MHVFCPLIPVVILADCADYWHRRAKDMHIKDRRNVWRHIASLGWKGLNLTVNKVNARLRIADSLELSFMLLRERIISTFFLHLHNWQCALPSQNWNWNWMGYVIMCYADNIYLQGESATLYRVKQKLFKGLERRLIHKKRVRNMK
jgi:hypothetical protein